MEKRIITCLLVFLNFYFLNLNGMNTEKMIIKPLEDTIDFDKVAKDLEHENKKSVIKKRKDIRSYL